MEILGIGPLEALFILILALLVIGPGELGRTARSLGRFLNRLYRSEAWSAMSEASRNLRTLPNRLAREAALEELDEARSELKQAGQGVRKEFARLDQELRDGRAGRPPAADSQDAADPSQDQAAEKPESEPPAAA